MAIRRWYKSRGLRQARRAAPCLRLSRRDLRLETLEDRIVLASPQLIGINPNVGELLREGAVLDTPPQELTFRFDEGQQIDPNSLSGIQITRGKGDIDDVATNVAVEPGFISIGESPSEVVVRFTEALPDDRYQIDVFGSGPLPLRNLDGESFDGNPTASGNQDFRLRFTLDLGPQVVVAVPQPVTRGPGGVLNQARSQIVVYFNNDDLDPSSVTNPDFYRLIRTEDTVTNTDDTVLVPSAASPPIYDADSDTVVLTFDDLPSEIGTFRLRVGTAEPLPLPPADLVPAEDPGSSFASALDLAVEFGFTFDSDAGNQVKSVHLTSAVDPELFPLAFVGANNEPGHRQVTASSGAQHVPDQGSDSFPGITEVPYNFRTIYGQDAGGGAQINQITARQKRRAREVFELWGNYLGVTFYETVDQGLTVATGDADAILLGPTVILDATQEWNDEFGNNWFGEALRQVGSQLGLGDTPDLPQGTIMGADQDLINIDPLAEPVFPGDHDIVHGQYLHRPESNDIDLYQFAVANDGLFTAETFAERSTNSSLLDTVLRLYRQTENGPELVAQNDDYYSNDSYILMHLPAGDYFIGVSASGNDQYDPTIEASGFGGTSQGAYDLRMDFRPDVNNGIVDTTGTVLDGDADGIPGGVFDFWFRAAAPTGSQTGDEPRTIFVDKSFDGISTDPLGALTNPFVDIDTALAAASAGDIVRIVGNRGTDNQATELTDYVPYQIGVNSSGTDLPDGRTLTVSQGVTVMIDAGAVFKMRRGVITVGSSSPAVNRSGGSIQVLGTPEESVYFTSLNDETIGNDVTTVPTTPRAGDWGGIIIRSDVDQAEGNFLYDQHGVFLNTINHADMRYGGGNVVVDALAQVINPIHVINTRPTISFNSITQSADAAMSATPDSFRETNFHAPEFQTESFTSDYDRVGPDIHHNRLVGNTTNGLFLRVAKQAGNVLKPMTVSGRWNDTDIVHVLQENLILQGQPGGPLEDEDSDNLVARLDARLRIDPGTIVKLNGARIEAQMGADFYAEGTAGRRVVLTSLQDDRFGAGGTFDTNGDVDAPVAGDWAGVLINHTSIASFDHAVVAFGGGLSPLEGSFAGINPIEVHQATARISNSVFENNARGTGGLAPEQRFGRQFNAPATIFVRGAQPVIVQNVFRNNDSPAVNINANALNHFVLVDQGRVTGPIDLISEYQGNQGPLIRGNLLSNNSINGMEVRGDTLTTESVWDDTDIVHVLRDTIMIPNFHTYGGLRLESSSSESLVVKLLGEDAGFTTTGTFLEIPDRIGGRIQVVGQPGRPVVLTSLFDDTVGAGFDEDGRPQTDTNNGGRPVRTPDPDNDGFQIDLNFGPLILQNPEALEAAQRAASIWELQLQDPVTVVVDVEMADLGQAPHNQSGPFDLMQTVTERVSLSYDAVRTALMSDAGAHEPLVSQLPTMEELNVNLPANPTNPFTVAETMQLTRANAKALSFPEDSLPGTLSEFQPNPADEIIRDGRITVNSDPNLWDYQRRNGLFTYREDFVSVFLRELGEILGFVSSVDTVSAALDDGAIARTIEMAPLDLFRFAPGEAQDSFADATRLLNPLMEDHVFFAGGPFDPESLGLPIAGIMEGEIPLAKGRELGDEFNDFGAAHWLDNVFNRNDKIVEFAPIGVMDPVSVWRDELIELRDPFQETVGLLVDISEQDREAFDAIGFDVVGGTPGDWQGIRMERPTHDTNAATILEQERSDVAAPGTNATPDTAQFLGVLAPDLQSGDDNQRLAFEVHGLLNSRDDVDIYSFTAVAGTEVWFDIDRTTTTLDSAIEVIDSNGLVLARSESNNVVSGILNPQPLDGLDYFTSNPHDPGMRVVLPGIAGTPSNHLIRVSSGLTSGQYQLQVRLQSKDVVPGTSVQFADIRYAEAGIRIIGPPMHSPLAGEQVEDDSINDAPRERDIELLDDEGASFDPAVFVSPTDLPFEVGAQDLGNLLATDRASISVSGSLDSFNDVDWYEFEVDGAGSAGVVFDIDYAAGLGRADTTLAVFDPGLNLRYFSDHGIVADDLPELFSGNGTGANDLDDLSRGSVSTKDAFLGPITLSGTWLVAVSSNALVPADIARGTASLTPIIPGLTDRGETVSNASGEFIFEPNSALEDPIQSGEYQLEIRFVPVPAGGFDETNATVGDKNRSRVQGQLIVDSNSIRDSLEWGIVVEDALRDMPLDSFFAFNPGAPNQSTRFFFRQFNRQPHQQFTNADFVAHSAPARALPVLDEERVVPGVTVKNNLVTGGVEGGIQVHGDPGGFIINTYDLKALTDLFDDFGQEDIEATEFTIWDHQRHSVTFEFTSSGGVRHPGHVPLRFDLDPGNDDLLISGDYRWVNPPTIPAAVASEIEHAIRASDLDVKVYRPNFFGPDSGMLFIEGAIEIGHPDIWNASHEDVFFPDDSPLPIITAEIVQQGSVPFARVVNNTVVGRGGDLFDASGVGDIGILVEDNASPTILNNIVANFDTGFQTDLTSTDEPIDRRTFLSRRPVSQTSFDLAELEAIGGTVTPFGASILRMIFDDEELNPLGLFIMEQGLSGSLQVTDRLFPWARNIDLDPTEYVASRPSVMGAAVYQGNLVNSRLVGIGDFPITLQNDDPLFVDPSSGNFLLAEGSSAIDSSIERLTERDRLAAIKGAVGIAESDILAPDTDQRGQFRTDDPSVEPPVGLGANVFKDRGAFDRVDFSGPSAVLVNPVDNDAAGADKNPAETVVRLVGRTLGNFSIQLVDGIAPADPSEGTGANDLTVTSSTVVVTGDGAVLLDGVDYRFAYDKTNDIIRLSSLSGIWAPGQEYVITLSGIEDMAGNPLKANQADGTTRFSIDLDRTSDFGDAPDPPYPTRRVPTGQNPEGASHNIVDAFFLGASVSADPDGQPNQGATGDDFDDGVELVDALVPGSETMIRVTATGAGGLLHAWIDFDGDGQWESPGSGDNPVERVFVNQPLTPGVNTLSVAVPDDAVEGFTYARFRFSTQANLAPGGSASDGEVEDYIYFVGEAGAAPWQNPANPLDVNADGNVNAQDVLTIFNDLNNPGKGARELPVPPIPPNSPPPFLDVNGDGFVAPVDALIVINFLNLSTAVGASQVLVAPNGAPLGVQASVDDEMSEPRQDQGSSGTLMVSPFTDALTFNSERPDLARAEDYQDTHRIESLVGQENQLRRAHWAGSSSDSGASVEFQSGLDSSLTSSVTDEPACLECLNEVLPEIAEEIALAWRDGSERNGTFG